MFNPRGRVLKLIKGTTTFGSELLLDFKFEGDDSNGLSISLSIFFSENPNSWALHYNF